MNETSYHTAEVKIDPLLPTPGVNDVAELFGTSARQMDQGRGVETVNRQQGVYRVGVTGAGVAQIKSGREAANAQINPDFYLR